MSAARLVALMRARELSPVEVLEAHLARVGRLNPTLNAVVTLAPDALERAREAERRIARGESLRPLEGLPVTVKDTIDTAAVRTTSGSLARAGRVPEADAPAVALLRGAGAVVFGKTNVSELALDYTAENPVFGRTVNPHDAARTPGGSSGGCAAAVAACLTPASLGSDMVGSIRIPAHFCGVVGLKPTAGRVPPGGHFPPTEGACALGASLGPLARTVEDAALLFDALVAGHADPQQSQFDPSRLQGDQPDRSSVGRRGAADGGELRGLRAAFYTGDGNVRVCDETKAAVEAVAKALAGAGCDVREERPPHVERGPELWRALFAEPVREIVRETYAGREELAGPAARALLAREGVGPARARAEMSAARRERERLLAELVGWMGGTPLVFAPVGAVAAFEHGARRVRAGGEEVSTFRAFGHAQTFNAFGLPVVCVPAGRTRAGLPVGVQIVGRPNEERFLLRAARAVERALGGWQGPTGRGPSEDRRQT
jgi:amidase